MNFFYLFNVFLLCAFTRADNVKQLKSQFKAEMSPMTRTISDTFEQICQGLEHVADLDEIKSNLQTISDVFIVGSQNMKNAAAKTVILVDKKIEEMEAEGGADSLQLLETRIFSRSLHAIVRDAPGVSNKAELFKKLVGKYTEELVSVSECEVKMEPLIGSLVDIQHALMLFNEYAMADYAAVKFDVNKVRGNFRRIENDILKQNISDNLKSCPEP